MSIILNTKIIGTGTPLVILHGLFGSWENWGAQAKLLANDFTVYALDARNHGRSAHSNEIDYPLMAEDVVDTLKSYGIEKAAFIGHSMGGKTAMQIALSSPEIVDKLVVVDIAPKTYEHDHDEIFEAMLSLDMASLTSRTEADNHLKQWVKSTPIRTFLAKNIIRDKDQFKWKINLSSIHKNYDNIATGLITKTSFQGPTLFIKGQDSNYLQKMDQPLIAQLFPNAHAKVIHGAGHWPHAEKSTVFYKIVHDFLTNNRTRESE